MLDDNGFHSPATAFAEHFTDPVYDNPSGEFAPFGTDEGYDLLYEWAERRDELDPSTTVATLVDESGFGGIATSRAGTRRGPGYGRARSP